jgi:hypothetical protein
MELHARDFVEHEQFWATDMYGVLVLAAGVEKPFKI